VEETNASGFTQQIGIPQEALKTEAVVLKTF
jgi:hypothetical protein